MRMSQSHTKLTALERENIAIYLAQNLSKREIARRLNRSDSTIRTELKRNRYGDHYVALHAQAVAVKRKIQAGRRHPLKNRSVYAYTLKKLRCGWSPEQISGRLKLKHPHNPYWHLHHETIYRFIHAKENREKRLWEYLPRKQKKRRQQYGRKALRVRIPDRVSIHDRLAEVDSRLIFGHWEGDSIEGRYHHGGMHTEVERKTRFTMAQLVKTLTATETALVVSQMYRDLPSEAKLSTTVDNGKENTNHQTWGIPTYFCDPYASWQKGTNENTNGLIRRYLPKKTDLTLLTQAELDDIIGELNRRPRKCLGFYTPQEMFEQELQAMSARIQKRM